MPVTLSVKVCAAAEDASAKAAAVRAILENFMRAWNEILDEWVEMFEG